MSLRQLPPAAAPLTWSDWWRGVAGFFAPDRSLRQLERSLGDGLGVPSVFLVSSGRAGLTLILQALQRLSPRRRVIVPGYTCFSVAAAVVKAGLEVVPCEMSASTLDFDYDELERLVAAQAPLCVVATHLFGLPADVARVRRICGDRGVFIVDDAAQALGLETAAGKLGTLGDVGFYSFDRGKNLTSGHGGAVVTRIPELARELERDYGALGQPAALGGLRSLVEMMVLSVLIRPSLYWIPASLPFLRLGETVYSTEFAVARLSGVEAGFLTNWRERVKILNEARAARVAAIRRVRPDLVPARADSCIRLPILCASREERDRVFEEARRARLGFSLMYPSAIRAIPALAGAMAEARCPTADSIAERLVTVPVHPLVSASDNENIEKVLKGVRPPVQ